MFHYCMLHSAGLPFDTVKIYHTFLSDQVIGAHSGLIRQLHSWDYSQAQFVHMCIHSVKTNISSLSCNTQPFKLYPALALIHLRM